MSSNSVSDLETNLSPVSELAIDLDRNRGDALHHQIESSIRQRVRSGALPAGVALPPTRALAAELGCHARRCRRGLRAARGRGLPDQPQRGVHAGGVRSGRGTTSRATQAGARGGEVLGFRLEVRDEGLQSDRARPAEGRRQRKHLSTP